MKKSLLMILLFLGCISVHAQTDDNTLVSIAKMNWVGVTDIPGKPQFSDENPDITLRTVADGLAITNTHVQSQICQSQVNVLDGFSLDEGHYYIVRLTAKVPSDGTYQVDMGDGETSLQRQVSVRASDEFQIIVVEFPEYISKIDNGHVLLQVGRVVGTTIIKEVEIVEKVGYWNNMGFVELTPDESSNYEYVLAKDEKTLQTFKSKLTFTKWISGKIMTEDASVIRVEKDRYYIQKDYSLPQGDYYVSKIYRKLDTYRKYSYSSCCVLPRIAVYLKAGFQIDEILEHLGNNVTLEFKDEYPRRDIEDNPIYWHALLCQMSTSEEVMDVVRTLNVLYKSGEYGIYVFHPFLVGLRFNPDDLLEANNLEPGGTTAIKSAKTVQVADGAAYNLVGQKVGASYKGVVIQNGKKVMMK